MTIMNFIANITVMPLKELLDPQGKAVNNNLHNLGLSAIQDVRIGKHIQLSVEAENESVAKTQVEEACQKLLHNAVMESYSFTLTQV